MALYDSYLSDPRVVFVAEPAGLEVRWRAFTGRQSFSPHVWNDAYLAAFALVAGFELVTFDQGFAQYAGLASTILA